MKYEICGTVMQTVRIFLEEDETVYSELGSFSWMSENINMKTVTREGGMLKGVMRAITGEAVFVNAFTCNKGKGEIAFSSEFPGEIIAVELKEGESRICQRDAFLCAQKSIALENYGKKKLAFKSGEGLIMQRITGPGIAFVVFSGEIIDYTLGEEEFLIVDTGHIAMYEPQVKLDVEIIKGVTNILFGGEGLYQAKLRGPGKVWLQSMPLGNLAGRLKTYLDQLK